MDLPYKSKFENIPEIELNQLVDYFNLEFATQNENDKFVDTDFIYEGIHTIDGIDTMCWSVKNCKTYALVKPFEDSYIIEMGDGPK